LSNVGNATLSVIPSFDGFQNRLERGTLGPLGKAGTRGGTLFGDKAGRSAGQRFGSVFKSAAKAGILGGLAIAAGAIKLGADALGEATESIKVGRQTAAVIKSTGGAAQVSKGHIGDLANRLSYMAGVDDELVQSSENVLLTFKDIRNVAGKNNKIFDRGAKVALNMSKALGTDLKGSTIQVGKALNDPIKGITALTRVGVTFTDQQKAQITALVKGGDANAAVASGLIADTGVYNNLLKEQDGNAQAVYKTLTGKLTPAQKDLFDHYAEGNHTLEAQKTILKELGSEFGGSARSQATASDRLKVAFGNLEEKIGKKLLPVVQDFSRFLLRKGVPAAEALTDWVIKKGVPRLEELGDKLRPLANELLPAAADAFKDIKNFASDALPFVERVVKGFNDMPPWVKKGLIGGAVGGLAAKKLGLGNLVKGAASSATGGVFSKGGSPVNPLWVKVVGGGLGVDGPGGKTGSVLNKAGIIGAILAPAAVGLKELYDFHRPTKAPLAGLGGGGINDFLHQHGLFGPYKKDITDVQKKWIDARLASQDYAFQVKNGIPRSAITTVTNWPLWNARAEEYLATILEIRSTINENKLDRAGGSGATPGSGIDPSNGTRPHGRPRGERSSLIHVEHQTVIAQDTSRYLKDQQARAWRVSAGGAGE
jgi:hypothetical protein